MFPARQDERRDRLRDSNARDRRNQCSTGSTKYFQDALAISRDDYVAIHRRRQADESRPAGQLGLQQRDVSNSLLISLSSSGQVAPNEWLNWSNGVSYGMAVQTPQYRMDSLAALMRTPIS